MLFHVSLEADRPQHVATVMAELWDGRAFPFPQVGKGSWVAFAGDDRGTLIEFYQRGTELHQAPGDAGVVGLPGMIRRNNPTHVAVASNMEIEQVLAIAAREGWPAKVCDRDGIFHVIEFWIEGSQLIEVLTPAMQQEYLDAVTIENWERMLAMPVAA